jgi:hypothetical protein
MNDLPYLGYEGCQLFSFLRLSKWIGFGVFERTVDGNVCITVHHLLVEQLGRVHVLQASYAMAIYLSVDLRDYISLQ